MVVVNPNKRRYDGLLLEPKEGKCLSEAVRPTEQMGGIWSNPKKRELESLSWAYL